ncbi:hypothetical protein HY772_08700 [Candidatus Woesearchaeota archaeon]|nr:hypothetical protein [Candidatus Woesearchaeota archaeon]
MRNEGGQDWLKADDSYLPTNQLPLLRSMLGRRLINIKRIIRYSPATWINEYHIVPEIKAFFRKADAPVIFEMEGLPPIYFLDSGYDPHFDEYSIGVTQKSPYRDQVSEQTYTLNDRKYLDDRLFQLINQRIQKIRILIRTVEYYQDTPRALQDGIEITFDNGTAIVLSYMLGESAVDILQIFYPEEVRWDAVQYKIDIVKGRLPWLYRFRRWMWRALDRTGRRIDSMN